MTQRRSFLKGVSLLGVGIGTGWLGAARAAAVTQPAVALPAMPEQVEALVLSDAEWRERLSREQYRVLRQRGTEPPFSSPLDAETRAGEYLCSGCGLLLFRSEWKYDSGTGWPSFWEVVDSNVVRSVDFFLFYPRVAYDCARCGGHQGHVFDDGPADRTGLRYCNNGVSLVFQPRS